MQNLKITLVPMFVGIFILLTSWYFSYPLSIDSPFDFVYNHVSYLYWIGVSILFASFFTMAFKTESNKLRWLITIGTVLLIFSQTYFYYSVSGSDSNQFRALTESFVSTGELDSAKPYSSYYEWPIFFLLNKMIFSVTGLDLRFCEFILYSIVGLIFTSFIFLHISKVRKNAYVAVVSFFIVLFYFFNFQFWSPFGLSLCLFFILLYFESLPSTYYNIVAIVAIFSILAFTHILTPLFFIVYLLLMYFLKKKASCLILFIVSYVIYILVISFNPHIGIEQLLNFSFFEYLTGQARVVTASSIAPQPFIDTIAQLFSRIVVIGTGLITIIGFVLLLLKKKFRTIDYVMMLTGLLFALTLIIAPHGYSNVSNRSYFLLVIPASMGVSYLFEGKFRKYFKTILLILLVLFTFVLMHQSFFDREIFFQTRSEHQFANFIIGNTNWSMPASLLSNYRLKVYLASKSSSANFTFDHNPSEETISNYDYFMYDAGLAKTLIALNVTIEESFEVNHFNLIYNSGNFSSIFRKNPY